MKIMGFILSLLVAGAGIWQYRDAKEKEFKKVFYEERFRVYAELSDIAARIALLPPHTEESSEAVRQFFQLTIGRASLVGDAEVWTAIRKMSYWIAYCVKEKVPLPPDDKLCSDLELGGTSYAMLIAEAARNSIVSTWNVPLEKLGKNDLSPKY